MPLHNIKPLCILGMLALLSIPALRASAEQLVLPIWEGVAPGSEKWTQKEVEYRNPLGEAMVRNVVRPTLTAYLPERTKANGTAVIICPGGGFRFLSWKTEGTMVAEWLRERGVAAFVLKYRLVDMGATEEEFQKRSNAFFNAVMEATTKGKSVASAVNDPATVQVTAMASEDGRQAIRVVRQHTAEWGISPEKIGIMGFSAGGMVTSQVLLKYDTASRPNFAAPIYGAPFDNEVSIPKDAPPIFVVCASDDLLMADQSMRLYSQWKAAKRSAELHLYAKGGHGFGMRPQGLPVDHWIERFGEWLKAQKLL